MTGTLDMEKIENGLTYAEFLSESQKKLEESDPDKLEGKEKIYHDYRKLNMARSRRLEKTYKPQEEAREIMGEVASEMTWLMLTEDWCGDSAQNLPVIAKLADLSDKIQLKILKRDENLDVMDLFLSDGKRSIPKVIALNKDGEELFSWGPRPASAKALVKDKVEIGVPKEKWAAQLHAWYARNKGLETETEFTELVKPFTRS